MPNTKWVAVFKENGYFYADRELFDTEEMCKYNAQFIWADIVGVIEIDLDKMKPI